MTASLLEAAKAGIADSKKYLYRHLEVSYNDCTPPHQSGRDYKVLQMHQAVAKALHEEGYQVRYESFPPERHDFGTTHIWTIYWGPSCPHCGKATG
jgi:hypothetical protein